MAPVGHVQAMLDKPEPVEPDGLAPIKHGKFELYASGLVVNGDPTLEEWTEIGQVLAVMDRGIQFLVGDWIRFGEERFKEAASQVVDHRTWAEETVRGYVWLSKNVPRENRFVDRGLSMKHHQIVAAMPPAKQRVWLRRALNADGDTPWTASKLQAAIKGSEDEATVTGYYLVVRCKDERDRDTLMSKMQAEGRQCKTTEKHTKVIEATPVPAPQEAGPNVERAAAAVTAVAETAPEPVAEEVQKPAGEHARRIGRRAESGVGRYVREHGPAVGKRKSRGGKTAAKA